MAKLIIDAGHGEGNVRHGVMDTGAVGSGTTEHEEAEAVRAVIVSKLAGRCDILLVPNDNKTITEKRAFIDAHLAAGDLFFSLHLNSGVASATGIEVLYDDVHSGNATEAGEIATSFATGMGLKNRGAKKDTEAAVGNVLILGGAGRRYLIEMGFVSHPRDVEAIRAHAADTIVSIIENLLTLPPAPMPTVEFQAAWDRLIAAAVYGDHTKPVDVLTADRLAVILCRLVDAVKENRI